MAFPFYNNELQTNHIFLTNISLLLLVCLLLHCANHVWLLTFVAVFSLYLSMSRCPVSFFFLSRSAFYHLLSVVLFCFVFLWLQLLPMRWREVSLFSLSFLSPFLSLSLLPSFHCFSPSLISCALFTLPRYLILSTADVIYCMQWCSMLVVHVLHVQTEH